LVLFDPPTWAGKGPIMCSTQSVLKDTRRSPKHRRRSRRPTKHPDLKFRPKEYSEAQRQLAATARKVTMNRDVLYHGTRHAQSILTTGVVFPAEEGGKVCFTRSAEEAAYWALLKRDHDEGRGAILIFDRLLLRCRYKIEPYHDQIWDDDATCRDEAEEAVGADVVNVGKYLVGLVSEPAHQSSARLRILNSEHRMTTEARLNQLLRRAPDWRFRHQKEVEVAAATHELACKALSEGAGIATVVEQLGLKISAVRRLAGDLKSEEFRRSLAQIVFGWIFRDLLRESTKISASRLAGLLGMDRVNLLMNYSGLPRDDLLNLLSRDLSFEIRRIGELRRNAFPRIPRKRKRSVLSSHQVGVR